MVLLAPPSPTHLAPNNSESLANDIELATRQAYASLVEQGHNIDAIHVAPVCNQASSLIVNSLLENSHSARHEIQTAEGVGEHSYVVVTPDEGEEILIDSTWQQFLSPTLRTQDLPRVLVGQRSEVIGMARSFGADESKLKIWQFQPNNPSIDEYKSADRTAEAAAAAAEADGLWEKFSAGAK